MKATIVADAIIKFAQNVSCRIGDVVFKMNGLPIGAIPSATAVNVNLEHIERKWLSDKQRRTN